MRSMLNSAREIIRSMSDIGSFKKSFKLLVSAFFASALGMAVLEFFNHRYLHDMPYVEFLTTVLVASIGVVFAAYSGFCGYIHVKGNLVREIKERTNAEKKLQELYQNLEEIVQQRTSELQMSNNQLLIEIDERERIEVLLKKSEARLRGILSSMSDMVFAFDAKTRFTFAHLPLELNMYISPELFLGKAHNDVMPKELHVPFSKAFSEILDGHISQYEYSLPAQDSEKWYSAILSPAYKDGKFDGAVAVIRDITETKIQQDQISSMMEELKRSNEDLEQFAYVASHDLKDPLVTLGGYLKRIERKHSTALSEDVQSLLGRAILSVHRMELLIDQLLAFASMHPDEKGFSQVDLEELTLEVVERLSVLVKKEGALVYFESLPSINGERIMLGQMLQNLISNAIKHRRDIPPEIIISSEIVNDEWVISVKDNGSGIPVEYSGKIFQLFERINHAHRDSFGIGLAVCKKIAAYHGGRIWVESELGKGSVFKFTVPFSRSGESA